MAGIAISTISLTKSSEGRILTMLRREEIRVVSKAFYIHDRSRNTEPNMLLRTQLVLHSEGILNLPL